MNITKNETSHNDMTMKNLENSNIAENNSSFCPNKKKLVIIIAAASIVVIALVVILVVLLKKKKDNKIIRSPNKLPEEIETQIIKSTVLTELTDQTDLNNITIIPNSTNLTELTDLKNSDEEEGEDEVEYIGNHTINESNYVSTTMKKNFKISSNETLQIVGADFVHKNNTLIAGQTGKVFKINEEGQIKGVTNADLPLYYSFNDAIINGSYLFKDVKCFKTIDLSKMDGTKMVDASNMFENSDFEEIYFGTENSTTEGNTRNLQETLIRKGYFETTLIKTVNYMFLNCKYLIKILLSPSFNVGRNAKGMFKGCTKLEELNTNYIISNEIEEMESMFEDCTSLREIAFCNDFLTGEVRSLFNTFKNLALSLLDIIYLRLFNLQSALNIFIGTAIRGTLKIGKYYLSDTLRNSFFVEIAKVTDSTTTVYTPSGTTINQVFEEIYYRERNTRININIVDIDYNINYREDQNYILYSNALHCGLGWDYNAYNVYDLDSSVVTFDRKINYLDRVNYQHLIAYGGVMNLNGDDLTGDGEGDDEEIRVTLDLLPPEVKFFTVQINSYRGNSLKDVRSAYIRLSADGEVIGTYSINQAGDNIGLLIGCFFKNESGSSNAWSFKPLNKVIPGHIVTESVVAIREILRDIFGNETDYNMITKLMNSAKYISQKRTLSIIGNLLFDNSYETSFVAGVLANVYHEGEIGKFESSAYSSGQKKPDYLKFMDELYDYRNQYSGKIITEVSMFNLSVVLDGCRANNWEKGKFGLGCVQWTGERTYSLFLLYQQKCDFNEKITIEQATAAEGEMIINELKWEYSHIYNDWRNANSTKNTDLSAYNAAYNFCIKYEVPDDKENACKTRGNTAKDMYKIMTS